MDSLFFMISYCKSSLPKHYIPTIRKIGSFNNTRLELLNEPIFLVFLLGLILNDHLFKSLYSNFFTGKLSDFCGLFIFPYFISALWPRKPGLVFVFTSVLFIVWKSPYIQPLLDKLNYIGVGVNRVIDYSDYSALAILPISYFFVKYKLKKKVFKANLFCKIVLINCIFFSIATTLPYEEISLDKNASIEYEVKISKSELLSNITPLNNYSGSLEYNIKDSLFIIYISNSKESLRAIVNIEGIRDDVTRIQFKKYTSIAIEGDFFSGIDEEVKTKWKNKTTQEYKYYIQNQFIDKIKKGYFQNIYFDNLRIHNEWEAKRIDKVRTSSKLNETP